LGRRRCGVALLAMPRQRLWLTAHKGLAASVTDAGMDGASMTMRGGS
jgi:hypothetical protein